MAIIDKIQLSGTVYTIGNETTTAVTSASTDNEIPTAKAVYDAIPQGGGSSYTGVSGITINENNEIYYNGFVKTWLTNNHDNRYAVYWFQGGDAKVWINENNPKGHMNYLRSQFSFGINELNSSIVGFALGQNNSIYGFNAGGLCNGNTVNGNYSLGVNYQNKTNNSSEFASGQYNNSVSASTTWGDSGNTLFSVGNGTSNSARHNAFEIRQNGDIYISKDGQDVKLQDQLGGGGSSYTAGDGIDINNDVISVTGKVDTSAFTAHTADTVIHVTSAEKAAWNDKQDTLVSGTNIKTINNQSILGEGNIEIQGGGVNVVQTTGTSTADVMSQDAVTNALRNTNLVATAYSSGRLDLEYIDPFKTSYRTMLKFGMINGKTVANITTTRPSFSLVETSAITTSVTSSSTDTQVPSAKAVYDIVGNIETLLSKI